MSRPFSEKSFYLEEFRGRTLALAMRPELLGDASWLAPVVEELAGGGTRVVLLSSDGERLAAAAGAPSLDASAERLEGVLWRQLSARPVAAVRVPAGEGFERACGEIALRLRVSKLVYVDPGGGLAGPQGLRLSFVHQGELRELLDAAQIPAGRLPLLREIGRLVASGVPAVNLCAPEGLADELFTYAGSGTLFTRERYIDVRPLGIDDYDAAHDLVARGVEEGYLAPRDEARLDVLLAGAFGAFVEGRHLAGIAALRREAGDDAGEIVSLYTLTRFQGEGVGAHLVRFAVEQAHRQGLSGVFACTTSERVGAFFERQGFAPADPGTLPASKWREYDPERRRRVRCYRRAAGPRAR